MEIADLNLSVRTFNAICRAEIRTIPELYDRYQLGPEKLRLLIGKRGFEEIGEALAKLREEVWAENAKEREQAAALKPGDYLPDYAPELWGEEVTFDELAQMEGELVIVNDAWYPDDTIETDGEGEVMRVLHTEGGAVILDNGEPQREEIARQDMDDSVSCRYCTKVWRMHIRQQMEEDAPADQPEISTDAEPLALSIESPCLISMRTDLDAMLQKTVGQMLRKESSEATVTLKISLALYEGTTDGSDTIRKPTISHKITSAITSKESIDGFAAGDYALYYDEDSECYKLRELPADDGQMRLF